MYISLDIVDRVITWLLVRHQMKYKKESNDFDKPIEIGINFW